MSSFDSRHDVLNPQAEVKEYKLTSFSDTAVKPGKTVQEYTFTPLGSVSRIPDPSQAAITDAETRAAEILKQARKEAERIRAEAEKLRKDAEKRHAGACEDGHAKGFEDGKAEGRKEFESRSAPALSAVARVDRLYQELWQANEALLVKLAMEIARKVIFREVSMSPDVIGDAFKAAIAELNGQHQVLFRLHPDDMEYLESARSRLMDDVNGLMKTRFETDSSLSRGDLIMETDSGRLDATLKKRIDSVMAAVEQTLTERFDLEW